MTPSDDPFDARPTAELQATDALLDRVGARTPTPDDLDDPLVAALALMAAEIDLDAVPVETTRAALTAARPELTVASPVADAPLHDQPAGLVLDLRDRVRGAEPPGSARELRRPRRPPRPAQAMPAAAMAPPRSLARMPSSTGPGGRSPQDRRERRLRPMVAVAVAVTAIVLGSGVSAAITGGRSVNPIAGFQQVVADLTGGRTKEQATAFEAAKLHLEAAQAATERGDKPKARDELAKIPPRASLSSDDRDFVGQFVQRIEQRLAQQ